MSKSGLSASPGVSSPGLPALAPAFSGSVALALAGGWVAAAPALPFALAGMAAAFRAFGSGLALAAGAALAAGLAAAAGFAAGLCAAFLAGAGLCAAFFAGFAVFFAAVFVAKVRSVQKGAPI